MAKKQGILQLIEEIKREFNQALEEERRKEQAAKLNKQKKVTADDVVRGLNKGFKSVDQERVSNQVENRKFNNQRVFRKKVSNEEKFKKVITLRDVPSKIESKLQTSTEGTGRGKDEFIRASETVVQTEYNNRPSQTSTSEASKIGDKLRGKDGQEKVREAFILSEILNRKF